MHLPTQIPYTFPCSNKKASEPEIKTVSVPESTSNSGILPVLYLGYSKPQNLTQPFSQTQKYEMLWYSENISCPLLYQGLVMPMAGRSAVPPSSLHCQDTRN